MSEAKHTPGPWVAIGIGGPWEQRISIRAPGWGCVAHVGVNPSLPHWDLPQRSNACLIAAAPDLLKALQDITECYEVESGLVTDWHINAARAVIAKALGTA